MIFRRNACLLIVSCFLSTGINLSSKSAGASTTTPFLKKPVLESAQKVLHSHSGFFTENKGQWDSNILFVGDTSFGKVGFAKDAIYYQMIKVEETKEIKKHHEGERKSPREFTDKFVDSQKNQERTYQSQTIKLSFVNPLNSTIQGDDVLTHYNNYFIGNDPKEWSTHCRNFERVTYQDIWKGIDLAYFFTPEGMKYEYYVEPEADIQNLQVKINGAVLANQDTSLQITTPVGNILDTNLKVFDQITGKTIQSNFNLKNNSFSFQGISEKRDHTIVIDPLVYSTYLGGSGNETTLNIVIDESGNAYISGSTDSIDFPITPGAYQIKNNGESGRSMGNSFCGDLYISKLNATCTALLYSTYLGGSGDDFGGLMVDPIRNNFKV